VRTDAGVTTVTVVSRSGIGGVAFARTTDRWPDRLDLRLHVTGLESVTVRANDVSLHGAASAQAGALRLRWWLDGAEDRPLADTDPRVPTVKPCDAAGRPTRDYPLPAGGSFLITLPPSLLRDQPRQLTLSWIDFYRN